MDKVLVDGSNKSLEKPDEEIDPELRKGSPLQKSLKKMSMCVLLILRGGNLAERNLS